MVAALNAKSANIIDQFRSDAAHVTNINFTDNDDSRLDKAPTVLDLLNERGAPISPDLLPSWMRKIVDRIDYEGDVDREEKKEESGKLLFARVMANQALKRAQLQEEEVSSKATLRDRNTPASKKSSADDDHDGNGTSRKTPMVKGEVRNTFSRATAKGAPSTIDYVRDMAGDAVEATLGKETRQFGGRVLRAGGSVLSGDFTRASKEAGDAVEQVAGKEVRQTLGAAKRAVTSTAASAFNTVADPVVSTARAAGNAIADSSIGKAVSSTWAKVDLTPWN